MKRRFVAKENRIVISATSEEEAIAKFKEMYDIKDLFYILSYKKYLDHIPDCAVQLIETASSEMVKKHNLPIETVRLIARVVYGELADKWFYEFYEELERCIQEEEEED